MMGTRGRGQGTSTRRRTTANRRAQPAFQEAGRLFAELARWSEGQRQIERVAKAIITTLRRGGRVFFFGNGGSASESQHLAAELVGRFHQDRCPLPAIALTENIASLTAISNDYAYQDVFARQIAGLGQRGDVVIGLSTSGRSPNVLAGLRQARRMGLLTVGLTGGRGGRMREACDLLLCVPSSTTARIQEAHLLIGHTICELVDAAFVTSSR